MGSSVTFEEMAYDAITNMYLQHYGVKGQKKGSNRWWTPDKKLTPEGRIHYGYGDGRKNKSSNTISSVNTGTSPPSKQTLIRQKNRLKKLNDDYNAEWNRIIDNWLGENKNASFEDYMKARFNADKVVDERIGPKIDKLRKVDFSEINREEYLLNNSNPLRKFSAYEKDKKARKENEELEKKLAYRESNEEIDSETGLYLKNKDMSVAEDVKTINHGFDTFDTRNSNNCMLCTTTFDLRRRGYDVYAGQSNDGFWDVSIEKWYNNAKMNKFEDFEIEAAKEIAKQTGKEPKVFNPDSKDGWDWDWDEIDKLAYNKAYDKLTKEPEGSYGNLCVGYYCGGSHSIIYEIKNGKLLIHDGQVGEAKIIDASMLKKYGKYFKEITFTRLDNLTPNIENMKKDGVFI